MRVIYSGWGQQSRKREQPHPGLRHHCCTLWGGIWSENYSLNFVLCQSKGPEISSSSTRQLLLKCSPFPHSQTLVGLHMQANVSSPPRVFHGSKAQGHRAGHTRTSGAMGTWAEYQQWPLPWPMLSGTLGSCCPARPLLTLALPRIGD